MSTALVVTQPFGDYARGDRITNPATVKALLETNDAHVVKVEFDETPAKSEKGS